MRVETFVVGRVVKVRRAPAASPARHVVDTLARETKVHQLQRRVAGREAAVGGLEVAMDDAAVVDVFQPLADLDEQVHAARRAHAVLIQATGAAAQIDDVAMAHAPCAGGAAIRVPTRVTTCMIICAFLRVPIRVPIRVIIRVLTECAGRSTTRAVCTAASGTSAHRAGHPRRAPSTRAALGRSRRCGGVAMDQIVTERARLTKLHLDHQRLPIRPLLQQVRRCARRAHLWAARAALADRRESRARAVDGGARRGPRHAHRIHLICATKAAAVDF